MNKVLGFVVLFGFIFSSCATVPAIAAAAAPVVNHRYTNTVTYAVKGYERFGFIDLKASESTDDGGAGTGAKQSSLDLQTILAVVSAVGLGGWLIYSLVINPDSINEK
jgi:hypothetical protein